MGAHCTILFIFWLQDNVIIINQIVALMQVAWGLDLLGHLEPSEGPPCCSTVFR